jgi:hypothetical protein
MQNKLHTYRKCIFFLSTIFSSAKKMHSSFRDHQFSCLNVVRMSVTMVMCIQSVCRTFLIFLSFLLSLYINIESEYKIFHSNCHILCNIRKIHIRVTQSNVYHIWSNILRNVVELQF